jgi:hypothetical protein
MYVSPMEPVCKIVRVGIQPRGNRRCPNQVHVHANPTATLPTLRLLFEPPDPRAALWLGSKNLR